MCKQIACAPLSTHCTWKPRKGAGVLFRRPLQGALQRSTGCEFPDSECSKFTFPRKNAPRQGACSSQRAPAALPGDLEEIDLPRPCRKEWRHASGPGRSQRLPNAASARDTPTPLKLEEACHQDFPPSLLGFRSWLSLSLLSSSLSCSLSFHAAPSLSSQHHEKKRQ